MFFEYSGHLKFFKEVLIGEILLLVATSIYLCAQIIVLWPLSHNNFQNFSGHKFSDLVTTACEDLTGGKKFNLRGLLDKIGLSDFSTFI